MNRQPHLLLAHKYWNEFVQLGDIVIDATCGNGHDTVALAKMALGDNVGSLYAIDTQPEAIVRTRKRLQEVISPSAFQRITFVHGCHSSFPDHILPRSVKLIVYNLGYLPGGDKNIVTKTENTIVSIQAAMSLIKSDGMISITCYPGHPEGEREQRAIVSMLSDIHPLEWQCCHHVWLNKPLSPTLLILKGVL